MNLNFLKKLDEGKINHILFEDESAIRDYQAIQKTWFLKGHQRIIKTCGKRECLKLLGVLNYETGQVNCIEQKTYDAQVFLDFFN